MHNRKGIKVFSTLFIALFVILCVYVIYKPYINTTGTNAPKAPRLIAHAAGEIYGIRLTNSVQALDNSYSKGFRLFEVDINWTTDNIPVLVHDWGNANWFMNVKRSIEPQSFKEFKDQNTILGLQLMDLDMLEEWLKKHKDAFIITDVKENNLKVLNIIKKQYPHINSQIIPQIYSFEEYDSIKKLGHKSIILTLYKLKAKEEEIMDFCRSNPLFGITMFQETVSDPVLKRYSELGIPIYVHTVNDYNEYVKLRDSGAYGVYTDFFQPSKWVE